MDNRAAGVTPDNESEIMNKEKANLPCGRRKGYLGQTLREFRKEAGFTQAKVAEACSMSTAQYNYYEQGDYFPDTDRLIQICQCIGVDPLAVFAAALKRSEKEIKSIPVSTYKSVAKAFHNKINQIVEQDVTL